MRRSIVALLPVLGLVALGACSGGDRDTTAPRSISPKATVSASLTTAFSCDFSAMKTDARAFFASSRDPVFTLISDMSSAYKTGGASGATSKGLDILARVAQVRLTSAQGGTADAGGLFVNDVVGCTTLVPPTPDDFDAAAALGRGIFEVRGDAPAAPAALAYNATRGSSLLTGAASPLWGVEGTWPASPLLPTNNRYLVYGYPKGTSSDVRVTGFELGTLPTTVNVKGLTVGVCSAPVTSNGTTANLLVHSATNILLLQGTHFCVGHIAMGESPVGAFARRLASLLSPRSLFAQSSFDGIGGLPDGWSPFTLGSYVGSDITLHFDVQPSNGTVNTNISPIVTVSATRAGGLPVPPVVVTLAIYGNNGTPAFIINNIATTTSDGVNSVGIAKFDTLQFTKAGGYTIIATGSVGGAPVGTQSVLSALFNIKNQ
jgi:hypothetical protein